MKSRTRTIRRGRRPARVRTRGARTMEPAPTRSFIDPRSVPRCAVQRRRAGRRAARHISRDAGVPARLQAHAALIAAEDVPRAGPGDRPRRRDDRAMGYARRQQRGAPPGRSAIATHRVQRRAPRRVATVRRVVHACRRLTFVRERQVAGRGSRRGGPGGRRRRNQEEALGIHPRVQSPEAEHGDPVEEGQGSREGVRGRRGQAPRRRGVRVRATPRKNPRAAALRRERPDDDDAGRYYK